MIRSALALLVLTLVPGFATAEDATPQSRAAAIRAKLGEPNPFQAISFEGDLTIGGLWAGSATLSAKPHTYLRKPVWRVVEKIYIDYEGVEKRIALRYMLKPDLTLKSGAADVDIEGTKITTVFTSTADGIEVIRTTTKPGGKAKSENLTLKADAHATTGAPALILFARGLSKDFDAPLALPWFHLSALATGAAATLDELVFDTPKQSKDLWSVTTSDDKLSLQLSSDRKSIERIVFPSFTIVPKGRAGKREVLAEEKPATTWKQAFLKFGYGYHMARENLLRDAFHWESMLAHETKVTKSWTGPQDLDAFRKAWIEEFVRQSLHRPRADTERLLSMTLASGKITEKTDDKIVFAAHKNFGGGTQRTYTLKRVDGVWYIAHIKF